jgi:hypothetical protein
MESKERRPHFVRLNGMNDKLADMGIEFGITLSLGKPFLILNDTDMEDQDNLRSYHIRAWWRDNEQADYPSDYTDADKLFELSEMADAIDWLHESLSNHLYCRLERIVAEGKRAQELLNSINLISL